jgi:hypothetical protein
MKREHDVWPPLPRENSMRACLALDLPADLEKRREQVADLVADQSVTLGRRY